MWYVEKYIAKKRLINHNVVKIDTYRDINDTFELFSSLVGLNIQIVLPN